MFRGPHANTFHQDLKVIAQSTVEDFERALGFVQHKGAQSLMQAFLISTALGAKQSFAHRVEARFAANGKGSLDRG